MSAEKWMSAESQRPGKALEPNSHQKSFPVPHNGPPVLSPATSLLTWALCFRRPLYTRPKEPSPIISRTWYFSIAGIQGGGR